MELCSYSGKDIRRTEFYLFDFKTRGDFNTLNYADGPTLAGSSLKEVISRGYRDDWGAEHTILSPYPRCAAAHTTCNSSSWRADAFLWPPLAPALRCTCTRICTYNYNLKYPFEEDSTLDALLPLECTVESSQSVLSLLLYDWYSFAIIPSQLNSILGVGFINVISALGSSNDYNLPSEQWGIHCLT